MTIHQVRELLVELTAPEQLELAQWLIGRALSNHDMDESVSGQKSPSNDDIDDFAEDEFPPNGSNQSTLVNGNDQSGYLLLQNEDSVEREQQAYRSMHQSLWNNYPQEHVAIYDGQLIDHDTDGTALSQRIYERYPDDFVLIRRVEPQPERILRFRSPRFIQEPSENE